MIALVPHHPMRGYGMTDVLDIRPVERWCTCLQRQPDGPHIHECNMRHRANFLASWQGMRTAFDAGLLSPHAIARNASQN